MCDHPDIDEVYLPLGVVINHLTIKFSDCHATESGPSMNSIKKAQTATTSRDQIAPSASHDPKLDADFADIDAFFGPTEGRTLLLQLFVLFLHLFRAS